MSINKKKIGACMVAFALAGSLVPVLGGVKLDKSVAAGDNVAAIVNADGTTKLFPTLQAAADDIRTSDEITIKLLENVDTGSERSLWVTDGKKIKLDLNGKTISSSCGMYTIDIAKNNNTAQIDNEITTGQLTIVGSGTIKNTSAGSTTIRNYGTLILGDANSDFVVENTDKTGTANSTIKCEAGANTTINSGTYRATMASNIEGNTNRNIQCSGQVTINGGKFESYILVYKEDNTVAQANNYRLTINGGIFDKYIRPLSGDETVANVNVMANVEIYGGKFKVPYAELVKGHSENSNAYYDKTTYSNVLKNAAVWPETRDKDQYYNVHVHDQKVVVEGKAATCIEKGKSEGAKCSICGEVSKAQTDIPAKGHSVSDMIPAKAPTRHEEGYYSHHKCITCGKYFEDKAGTKELQASVVVRPALIDTKSKAGVASIDNSIMDEAIEAYKKNTEESKYVELIFADVDKSATTFKLPTQGMKAITNAGEEPDTMIVLPSGAIILFDANAVNAMVAASGNAEYIELSMKQIQATDMNEKQQAAIKDLKVEMIVSASVYCNGTYLDQFGEEGLAGLLIPFKGEANIDYDIVHIGEDGKVNETFSGTTIYENNEYMTLLTDHFSEYAIVNNGVKADDDKYDDEDEGGTSGSGGATSGGSATGGTAGGSSSSGKVQNVSTGDNANMTPWICILVGSVVAIIGVGIFAKKKKIW